jgi:two-component system, OmpR family, sensor histidine kinase ChvG
MSVEAQEGSAAQAPARQSRVGRAASVRLMRILRVAQTRLASSLTRRIVVLNLGGLVALLAGFLYLNQFRESLIDARVQSLQTQGEIIAAAVAASATVETDDITIDPDRLLKPTPGRNFGEGESGRASPEFSLNPERVGPLLVRLVAFTRTRARIYDRDGDLLLDSRSVIERAKALSSLRASEEAGGTGRAAAEAETPLETLLATLRRWMRRPGLPLYEDIGMNNGKAYPEVATALNGAPQWVVRANAKGETIISVAVPVQRYHSIRGALMLSTLGGDIDVIISSERWAIIRIFLVSSGVMLLLSLLFAGAIAEPMRRLAEAADRVRRGVKSRQEIPDFTDRQDEIGHLSGALRDMTRALYNRIEAIEHFAADVAHELKNPLTSLRSAVETLPIARTESARERLLDIIKHDVGRLDRLISDISDASRLDAELARADMSSVDLSAVLETVVGMANGVEREDRVRVVFTKEGAVNEAQRRRWSVFGHDSRLAQVFDNIIANARSFSPPDATVRVLLRPETGIDMSGHRRDGYEILIDDDGPGIPQCAFERIFERFYTDRPEQGFGQNSGLGLSISRQIVEAHGGRIRALNRTVSCPEGTDEPPQEVAESDAVRGARFAMWLPAER